MSRSLTSQIIAITTKSDNVIVEDWSKKKFIYFFHETEKCRAKTTQLSVSSYFLSVLEHSQGFFICFMIKNPLNSPRIAFYFPKQTLFSQRTKVSSACYTLIKHA